MSNVKTNKWLGIAVLLLLLANISTLVMLWRHRDINHPSFQQLPQSPLFEYICGELNFDSSQIKAYDNLRNKHRSGQKQFQDNVRQAKDEFYMLMQKQNLSDSLIKMTNEKVTKAIGEFELYNFKHFQQVRELCNAEQKQKFDIIIKDVLNRMGHNKRMPPPEAMGDKRFPPPPPLDGETPPKH